MATNLHIDPDLLAQAVKLGGGKTKRDTVNEALAEYVRKRRAKDLIALFGTIDYYPDHDHKKQRKLGTRKARNKTRGES
jgi:hypothetical protein